MAHKRWQMAVGGLAGLWALSVQALGVQQLTPQGQVDQVRQVVLRLDADAVAFGSAQGPDPAELRCSDPAAAQGTARWNNAREWVFQFRQPVPAGTRCDVRIKKDFKSASGQAITGTSSYQFNTGGPVVLQQWPRSYQPIDEQQYFVLQLNGPATRESLLAHVACRSDDVGERMPVRAIEGEERTAVLQRLGLDKAASQAPQKYPVLACSRRLSPGVTMQLVFGAGVATPSGIASTVEKRFTYEVREAFSAEMRCERENAQAACLPLRPIQLQFSAPVPRAQAQAVRLVAGGTSLSPTFEDEEPDQKTPPATVQRLRFGPLQPLTSYSLQLPPQLQDDAGRPLRNAELFPLAVRTGDMPPLAKFAAAPFGIVERFAEGPQGPALLPVTLRKIEAGAAEDKASRGLVQTLQLRSDADIIRWLDQVQRYHEGTVSRTEARKELRGALPPVLGDADRHAVQARLLSLLQGQAGVQQLELPRASADDPRPFEVVGIPLPTGFHVVEIASQRLGQALLDPSYGQRPMYVRTTALVTNLAVHVKLGREGSLVWVTSLDKGQPVAGATVQVSDCRGKAVAQGQTDAQGLLALPTLEPQAPYCSRHRGSGSYFVSARADSGGTQDMAFTWSDWQRGIEPWRFHVPTSSSARRDLVAHTVMDRMLVRAGETVSMKHFVRTQTLKGLELPEEMPASVRITHVGSGQEYTQPLRWRDTATGGRSAASEFAVPPAAKLGEYEVTLLWPGERGRQQSSGQFRVEAFRLPVLQGQIAPVGANKPLVRPGSLPVQVQLNYVAGGAAARMPVQVSALLRPKDLDFPSWAGWRFSGPQQDRGTGSEDEYGDEEMAQARAGSKVVANKLPLTLDRNGQGQVVLEGLPEVLQPQELVLEATYADPNGEVQTLRSVHTLWPATVVAGIRTDSWVSSGQKLRFQALALGLDGRAQAGVALSVQAVRHTTSSTRKRMVGGFYSYDNSSQREVLGEVCSGSSDSRGMLLCTVQVQQSGQVEFIVTAKDGQGHAALAASSVWVTRQGEIWFGGEDHDRMDVLPEKPSYEPGETARLQVRMPFRQATVLVSVEREGVLQSQVMRLRGSDPTIELPVDASWGPNVYVSVMALRGRLYEVPWYSFFTWGYKAPREWWNAFWHEGKEYAAPTALVDLSKPAYRLGMAELKVGTKAQQIQLSLNADQARYQVRGKAQVRIQGRLPDGKPAAGAEVAVAVVDQALLELMPNTSWQLQQAMWQRRSWGVQTATAQMEIIGRRHYGRKAVPAGGGGGGTPMRELLDTLLLWQPQVVLDAQGQALVEVPLNDALTTFQVVAVADAGVQWFGTGQTTLRTAQDLQIISGLPPLVRQEDSYRAQLTVRNTTDKAMKVEVRPRASLLELAPQTVELPAGEARDVGWEVRMPGTLAPQLTQAMLWEVEARDLLGQARDALKISQRLVPAVPVTVQQAHLQQLDEVWNQSVAPPANAVPGQGGLRLSFSPRLADGLPGVRDWWLRYPFACLEQTTSKAIGLADTALWQRTMERLPSYLDRDGLAHYFPPADGQAAGGSDTLTAHLLAVSAEAAALAPGFALPPALRETMERGLIAFVDGRIERRFWSPRQDLTVRKLAAIAALSYSGKAQARMLGSITIEPQQWPTHAVIDWLGILQRVPGIAEHDRRQQEALQVLKSRLSYQGSTVGFSTDAQDQWWWLMQGTDVNAARLLLATATQADWAPEAPRLVTGLLARQRGGAWLTTTANVWGVLALQKFSRQFESVPVTGSTSAVLGASSASVHWKAIDAFLAQDGKPGPSDTTALPAGSATVPTASLPPNRLFLPWGERQQGELRLRHQGTGKPWVTLQSLAAVPRTEAFNAGYALRKTVTPVEPAQAGRSTRGDVLRVRLEVEASADMTWVALTDPIPAGATILGSGLGRDSEIATQGERQVGWLQPDFVERGEEAFRSYYRYVPAGRFVVEYTVRLNTVGKFALPPSRVEALYAPEMFGELPNAALQVQAAPAR